MCVLGEAKGVAWRTSEPARLVLVHLDERFAGRQRRGGQLVQAGAAGSVGVGVGGGGGGGVRPAVGTTSSAGAHASADASAGRVGCSVSVAVGVGGERALLHPRSLDARSLAAGGAASMRGGGNWALARRHTNWLYELNIYAHLPLQKAILAEWLRRWT